MFYSFTINIPNVKEYLIFVNLLQIYN